MITDFQKYEQFMYSSQNVAKMMRESEEFISKASDNKFFTDKKVQQAQKVQKTQKAQARPKQHKHPIFWLLYKMVQVEDFYTKENKENDVVEMNFRIKFIETIKTDPGWMKANKIKISQVEGESMDADDIPLLGAFFRAVCLRNNVAVMVIKANIYKTVLCDDDELEPTFVIEHDGTRFGFVDKSRAKHAKENMFEFSKPIRAISAYKVDELKEIARRVGIADVTGLLKKQLYEKILSGLTF